MTDLHEAGDFWRKFSLCDGDLQRMSHEWKIPRKTLWDWKQHHEAGDLWLYGGWRAKEQIEGLPAEADPQDDDDRLASVAPSYKPEIIDWRDYAEVEIPIGITGDNHIGSKYERMDVLETAFEYWASQGVRDVYQCGNIIDGERVGINEYDIYAHGFEEQCANLIEKWPKREGITTHYITGQCHEGWYIKRNQINVGRRIEQEARDNGRNDLHFLGHQEHDLHLKQEGGEAKIRLIHPGGGSSYATSYKPQKIIESYQGGEKPNAVLIAHYHKHDTGFPREVWTCQVGCTQDQTPFMRQHNIAAHVGFVTLWLRQNSLGLITSWKVEWRAFYDRKFYTFVWDRR